VIMPMNPEIVTDPDNPEWTREQMARAMRFKDLPPSLQTKLSAIQEASRRKRGPQKAPTKILTALRLSPDVLEALRSTGRGWQSRVDETLRKIYVSSEKQT